MFLAFQQIDWDYAPGTYPTNGSFPYWQWNDFLWGQAFQTHGSSFNGGVYAHYHAYNYVHFESANWIHAWIQPEARASGDGFWECSFYHVWENPGPAWHFHDICQRAY